MSAIEVKNPGEKFHGQTVLHGIDLEVKPGEVVAIIGPEWFRQNHVATQHKSAGTTGSGNDHRWRYHY